MRLFLQKIYNSWQLFGGKMLLSKAWEKFVVDRYRFRTGIYRAIPKFKNHLVCSEDAPETVAVANNQTITICYFLHFFFPDKQGGTERFVLNLAHAQIAHGNTVYVISLGKRCLNSYNQACGDIRWTEFDYEGIPVIQMRYLRAPRGLYYCEIDENDPSMYQFALGIFSYCKPDIVHLAYPQPFGSVVKACSDYHIPVITTLTDFNMICHYASMVDRRGNFCVGSDEGRNCAKCKTYELKDARARWKMAGQLLRQSTVVTVPSVFVANVFLNEFPDQSFRVIQHGISNNFSSGPQIHKKTKRFLYAGTLSALKGVHLLIQAFRLLEGPAKLTIVGKGDVTYLQRLRYLARHDLRITFYDEIAQSDMPALYRAHDCIVVPSIWYETYNFVLREAMSCGCLGLCAKIGAMPEAIDFGKNGFYFEAGDANSLLHALRVSLNFDWANYVQPHFPDINDESNRYSTLYHNMLKQKSNTIQAKTITIE